MKLKDDVFKLEKINTFEIDFLRCIIVGLKTQVIYATGLGLICDITDNTINSWQQDEKSNSEDPRQHLNAIHSLIKVGQNNIYSADLYVIK